LPPTNFFSRLLSDESPDDDNEEDDDAAQDNLRDAAKVAEMESILSLCEARGLPSKMLRWHYRSKHHSLIEVSNEAFYGGDLFLPPSPNTSRDQEGFVFVPISGAYDRGGKRTNEIEARAIVTSLTQHASKHSDRSIGIVTFSASQRDLIANLVDEARRTDLLLDAFINDQDEETFIKNLENVQGDERDHILVSVGYGPRIPGHRLDSAVFGPVSREGGERRLNVLFTRARHRCEVFCSFDPADIDTERARSRGAEALKRYLTYAQSGVLNQPHVTGEDYDSPLEEDVARVIRSFGYAVDCQVGTAGFKIDLGVRHSRQPGRFIMAVECDGAAYHGSLWARERDRLRQEILEGQGWIFHRIWSTDWFYRRGTEIAKLQDALKAASERRATTSESRPETSSPPSNPSTTHASIAAKVPSFEAPAYAEIKLNGSFREEPHEVPPPRMSSIVSSIVNAEGPIHEEEIARRVATTFGKDRAGSRIQESVLRGLKYLAHMDASYMQEESFWFTVTQKSNPLVRNRSMASLSLQRAAMLPPLEIRSAALKTIVDNGAIASDELIIAVARMLGYQRTGSDLKLAIGKVLETMIMSGTLTYTAEGTLTRP
jgi:very-short-patch-repair endonuclease